MKSYLRFLSRNKLYTAIEVVGLSLALAFLIILGSILIDKSQVNDNIKDEDEIYALANIGEYPGIGQSGAVGTFLQQIPMVKEWCRFSPSRQVKMKKENGDSLLVTPMQVTSNFFSFFGIDLIHGDQEQALKVNGAVNKQVSSSTIGASNRSSAKVLPMLLSPGVGSAVKPHSSAPSAIRAYEVRGTATG